PFEIFLNSWPGSIIENLDVMSILEKAIRQIRTDEADSSGSQRAHGASLQYGTYAWNSDALRARPPIETCHENPRVASFKLWTASVVLHSGAKRPVQACSGLSGR